MKMEMEIIKGNQSEMKTATSVMKRTAEEIGRADEAQDRITGIEDGGAGAPQQNSNEKKESKKMKTV